MPRERDPPYVAAGFRTDAQKLLAGFAAKKSLKFADFAEVWRDLNFSTVFMGRENSRELIEFIEECYRNTMLLMDVPDPFQKVGAVYLMYSLYMKQPPLLLKAQIPIRISRQQAFDIYNLENAFANDSASGEDIADLIFIVAKLFKMEAFSFSCFPIPMGPVVPIHLFKMEPLRNSAFKEMLCHLKMINDNDIWNISNLCKRQGELQKHLPALQSCPSEATEGVIKFEEVKRMIGELEYRYSAGLCADKEQEVQSTQKLSVEEPGQQQMVPHEVKIKEDSIGQRRALLKAQQFESFAEFGSSKRVRSSSSDSSKRTSPSPVKRALGRPKKKKDKRRGKKQMVENDVKSEPAAGNEGDCVQVAAEAGDDQDKAMTVDEPEVLNPKPFFPYRRPPKYPRPVRGFYFENKENEDEDC